MKRIPRDRDERGSIAVTVTIIVVVSTLIVALTRGVEQGLTSSRRVGEVANALQVADAGVNDAIRTAPTVTASSFSRSGGLGTSGTYTYTATRDSSQRPVWHIDVVGTDRTGARRRIVADAVSSSLFNTPLFVNMTLTLSSGVSLDSYINGTSIQAMCTGKGVIGTNAPQDMNFGSSGGGQGVSNCQNRLLNNGWTYSMDGCTAYGDGTQPLPPMGPAKCPPEPKTFRTTPLFVAPRVAAPAENFVSYSSLTCDPSRPASGTNVQNLVGGTHYYVSSSVTLLGGCRVVNPTMDVNRPVTITTAGRVDLGNANGQGGLVNQPPTDTAICGATATSTLSDGQGNPASYYCPRWSTQLRIKVLTGNNGPVTIRGNNTKFWGAIEVPSGSLALNGSQIEVFGGIVANTASSNAQFTWHFDESLADVTTGQFSLQNWREEPIR